MVTGFKPDIRYGDVRDVLREMPDQSVQTVVTSPPYFGLRDYGVSGQIGLESTPDAYVAQLVDVFREVRRVLRDDGTVWLNLGDSYAANVGGIGNNPSAKSTLTTNAGRGPKQGDKYSTGNEGAAVRLLPDVPVKNLLGIPWRVAFALQADGWYLRSDIIWHKPNPMPESVTDRPTKAHEYIFLLAKSERYYYDAKAIAEKATGQAPGNTTHKYAAAYDAGDERQRTKANLVKIGARETRNRRTVWTVPTQPYRGAHFATMPEKLVEPCVLAGCPEGGIVLDPFCGSGTVGVVALHHGRQFIGIELNPTYIELAHARIAAGSKKCEERKAA